LAAVIQSFVFSSAGGVKPAQSFLKRRCEILNNSKNKYETNYSGIDNS
jgi:hypothetical protein